MKLIADTLDVIDSVLKDAELDEGFTRPDNFILTGELSSFEIIPHSVRAKIIERLKLANLYAKAFPAALARALLEYPDAPGSWILRGWSDLESLVTDKKAEEYLAQLIEECKLGNNLVPTRAKMLYFRAFLKAGKVSFPPGAFEGLSRYPSRVTESEKVRLEATIRASFNAFHGIGQDAGVETENLGLSWAKRFWRTNWTLYKCSAPSDDTSYDDASIETVREHIHDARGLWLDELDKINEKFLNAARCTDPDLYNPDRSEVLMGIVGRMLRATAVLIETPHLWSFEHGSSFIRSLVEARIVMAWLTKRNDSALYLRFKAYGRGRLKLLKLHLEEYRESLSEESPELDEQISELDMLVNQDLWEEFQEISVEGNFANIDTRKMAQEVDLIKEYRLLFAPASSAVHGEWASLDEHVLQRCRNPLHRWHRIPRQDLGFAIGPRLCTTALELASDLVENYVEAVAPSVTEPHGQVTSEAASPE